ncbi:MAG TPA: hypothetical protein VMT81_02445 [Candidatus Paceibacterota bacterium]|nr:hypothetical protein [Candidatus Paceibacterota bacterium]
MNRKGSALLVVVVIIVLIIIAGIAGYLIWKRYSQAPSLSASSTPLSLTASTTVISLSSTAISSNYNLFEITPQGESDCGGFASASIQYYDGGTITSGTYAGYHRIVAGVPVCGPPGGDYAVTFATQDYQTFIAQGTSSDYVAAKENYAALVSATSTAAITVAGNEAVDLGIYDFDFNYDKVSAFGNLPTGAPPVNIPLGDFVLVQNDYWYGDTPTSTPLKSLASGLTFYPDTSRLYTDDNTNVAIDTTYLGNDNDVIVKTDSGPLFDYFLIPKEQFGSSDARSGDSEIFYQNSQISSSVPLYKDYGQIAPGGCGGLSVTYLINNVSPNDLAQIGTTSGGTALFISTTSNAFYQLQQDEFNAKVEPLIQAGITSTDEDGFSPPSIPLPSSSAYFAKNPVLLFQDPWGRWTGLGELDIPTIGGCGE